MIQMKLVSSIREGKLKLLVRSNYLTLILKKIIENLRIKKLYFNYESK